MNVLTQYEAGEEVDPESGKIKYSKEFFRTDSDMQDQEEEGDYVCKVEVDDSPSKRRKTITVDTVANNFDTNLFSEALQGGVEVIYCERFNGDSPSQVAKLRIMLDEQNPVLLRLGIRAVAERAEKDEASGEGLLLKNIESYEGRVYNKLVLLRLVDTTSKKSRKQALVKIADLMNAETQRLVKDNALKANQPQWRVRKSFDRTPSNPANFRRLDDVVSAPFVVKLISEMYTGVGPTWGVENPELAAFFVAPPYAKLIRDSLFGGKS